MAWWDYVQKHARGDSNNAIAHSIGVKPSTVTRWKTSDKPPQAENVIAFARAYGRPPIEALAVATYLNADEVKAISMIDWSNATDEALAAEVLSRMSQRPGHR